MGAFLVGGEGEGLGEQLLFLFLGGGSGGKLKEIADVSVIVPEKETFKVQELHLPVYHCLCAMLENEFFG